MPLQFTITNAGRAAIAQVGGAIGPVTLTKIAIGSGGYTPTATQTALQTEIKRLDPSGSSVPVPGTISITAQDNSADFYSIKEIGLYTNNNVLFAICAQTAVIMTKASGSFALFAMDFVMTNVPAGTVTVGNVGFTYSQATETAMGVLGIATTAEAQEGTINTKIITPLRLADVTATENRRGVIALATTTEAQALAPDGTKALTVARLVDRTSTTGRAGVVILASSADTQTGTDANKAVTPAGLASRTATDTRAGMVELADNAETQTGTDTSRAVTPASLASRTATTSRAGIVELADNTETQTGTSTTLAVTPAGLASAAALFVPPGAVMPFASTIVPSGWLAANGQTIGNAGSAANFASETYSALFAVLWGSWTNTLLPILTSTGGASTRGATAAADFAANKRLPLPDLRGYFVRGSGKNGDNTESGLFGTKQADAFKSHSHPYTDKWANFGAETKVTGENLTGWNWRDPYTTSNLTTKEIGDTTETRPKNIALLYCIKF
jgi:hypothetical protein